MATKKASTAPFSAEERAAMREAAKEQKAALKGAEALQQLLDKVAEMPDQDREIAEKLHALIERVAPELAGKTWYGMPAYTLDGKTICFFQAADKFKYRYATLGFQEDAALDDGDIWATSFAIQDWTPAVEEQVTGLLHRALGKASKEALINGSARWLSLPNPSSHEVSQARPPKSAVPQSPAPRLACQTGLARTAREYANSKPDRRTFACELDPGCVVTRA